MKINNEFDDEIEEMLEEDEIRVRGLAKVLEYPVAPKMFIENSIYYLNSLSNFFKKPSEMPITEFSEKNLWLPKEVTAEDGLYRCDKTPYLREVMDCMHPSNPCNKVVFWSGTQLGKTQGLFNILFYYMANDPCGMVFGFSNDGEKKKMVQSRLDPIIEHNKWLSDLIVPSSNGKSGNTLHLKTFKGGYLTIASAQSPSQFRSMPARIVALDEIDAYPTNAKGEGDIVALAAKRTSTYGDRYKIYLSSTTTNKESKIMMEYENTDKRKYYVPCPKCGKMQLIDWERFHWEVEGTRVDEVYMTCEECGYHIHDYDKITMLPNGEWVSTNPVPTAKNSVGFWLSGLYAPYGWQSWEKCVTEYLEAVNTKSEDKLSAFYNCILALPYETDTEIPDWKKLYNESKGSEYIAGEVPNDVVFLVSGTDVQKNRLETEVVGFTALGRCVSIDKFQFYCDKDETTKNIESQCYKDFRNEVLDGSWVRKDGVIMRTVVNGMDRNYETDTVDAFWSQYNQPKRLILIRGDANAKERVSAMREHIPGNKSNKTVNKRAKGNDWIEYGKYRYIIVGVSQIKAELYKLLKLEDNPTRDARDIQLFPRDYDEEWFRQLTAEVPSINKNTKKIQWTKTRERNEALDLHVYCHAMWYYIKAYSFTKADYEEIEREFNTRKVEVRERTRHVAKAKRRILSAGGIY